MEELEYIKDERYADWIYIDGKLDFTRFLENSLGSSYFRKRPINPREDTPNILDKVIDDIYRKWLKKIFYPCKSWIKARSKRKAANGREKP